MSVPDDRPRPAYGEYATPEEQRARIQSPDVSDAIEAGVHPATGGPAAAVPVITPTRPAAQTAATPRSVGRSVDRVITIGLLGYGLVNVIFTAISFFDFEALASTYMNILNIPGEFTNTAQGELWGSIGGVVMIVGWVVTAAIAVRVMRRGRLTWWIPVVGAVVTTIVASACVMVPLLGDPAIAAYISSIG